MLKETGGEVFAGGGDHTTAVEGLYRYKGTYEEVTNNYICLGDENPDKCKTNPDNMYRIIGVTDGSEATDLGLEVGMLKVIKAISPSDGTSMKWASHETLSYDFPWDYEASNNPTTETYGATLRWYLNNKFYTGNTIDARIKPYIAEVKWWKGDNSNYPPTFEIKVPTSAKYYVGLMYAGDYYNSWTYATNTNSWLNICRGLSSDFSSCSSTYEWTMTRYGYSYPFLAWGVDSSGSLGGLGVTFMSAVRPVFYLTSNIELSGKGTEDNPFTIVPEKPKPALDKLEATTSEQYLKTVADNDELLRYVGTYEEVTNNFICFGTDDKEKCTSEPNTYMYRIIGITTDKVNTSLGLEKNQLKIIKATPSNTSQAWSIDNSTNIDWDNGSNTVRTYLNAETKDFLKTIKDITTKVGTHNWIDLIISPQWYIADNQSDSYDSFKDVTEKDKTTLSKNYKIGLMYASDYHNSCNSSQCYIAKNWLHISNGISESSSSYGTAHEWTMTRYGYASDWEAYRAWYVGTNGYLSNDWRVSGTHAVRPVFYLIPDITLTGSGTESNPFIINVE